MSNLLLGLSANLPASRIALITRDLSRDLSRAGISAKVVEAPANEGERGEAALLGQLALGLVSSGAVTALIGCLTAYLSRERALTIKLTRPDGVQVEINSHNVDQVAIRDALQAAASVK
jgi:hypothetical protein